MHNLITFQSMVSVKNMFEVNYRRTTHDARRRTADTALFQKLTVSLCTKWAKKGRPIWIDWTMIKMTLLIMKYVGETTWWLGLGGWPRCRCVCVCVCVCVFSIFGIWCILRVGLLGVLNFTFFSLTLFVIPVGWENSTMTRWHLLKFHIVHVSRTYDTNKARLNYISVK